MADSNVRILISAQDATQGAVNSVVAGLNRISETAAGFAIGSVLTQGIQGLVSGIAGATLGINNSLDSTQKQAVAMLDSIRSSGTQVTETFSGSAKQILQWGEQLREIRERESDGMADFAARTRQLNEELADALSGDNITKRLRDEQEALDDLTRSHQQTLLDIQSQIDDANQTFEERQQELTDELENTGQQTVVINGEVVKRVDSARQQSLEKQLADLVKSHDRQIQQLQGRIDKENALYQQQQDKRKRELDESLADLREANDKRIVEIRRELNQEAVDQQRFVRDIKEAYADLDAAKKVALSSGGEGGGFASQTGAVITYRQELQKLSISSSDLFNQFNKFFTAEAVRSPFNIADIQKAGAQLIQFSGGNLANMQQIVRMAEALASSPAVQQFDASERLNLGIRALAEAYNGQFISLERIFNIAGSTFDRLKEGTFTTTQFTNGLNDALQGAGINYSLVDANSRTLAGAWGNLVETGNLFLATISSPIYDLFRDKLVDINTWVSANTDTVNGWGNALKDRLAAFIDNYVTPAIGRFIDWLRSPEAHKEFDHFIAQAQEFGESLITVVNAFVKIVEWGAKTISMLTDLYNKFKPLIDIFQTASKVVNPVEQAKFIGDYLAKLIAGRANGGIIQPGELTLVGERGPELIKAPAGSRVFTADQTSQMLSGGNHTYIFNNYGPMNTELDKKALLRDMAFALG